MRHPKWHTTFLFNAWIHRQRWSCTWQNLSKWPSSTWWHLKWVDFVRCHRRLVYSCRLIVDILKITRFAFNQGTPFGHLSNRRANSQHSWVHAAVSISGSLGTLWSYGDSSRALKKVFKSICRLHSLLICCRFLSLRIIWRIHRDIRVWGCLISKMSVFVCLTKYCWFYQTLCVRYWVKVCEIYRVCV